MSFGGEIAAEAGRQTFRILAIIVVVALVIGVAIGLFAAKAGAQKPGPEDRDPSFVDSKNGVACYIHRQFSRSDSISCVKVK